jgi:hypothetical protein
MLLLAQTLRHQILFLVLLPKSASNNLPTGRLNLGINIEEKLTAVLIIPSSWDFPTDPVRHHNPPLGFHHSKPCMGDIHTILDFKLILLYSAN